MTKKKEIPPPDINLTDGKEFTAKQKQTRKLRDTDREQRNLGRA